MTHNVLTAKLAIILGSPNMHLKMLANHSIIHLVQAVFRCLALIPEEGIG